MIMKRSLNKMSPILNWWSTVALGVSKCPFATITWKTEGGFPFKIVYGADNRIFCKYASEMTVAKALVAMKPSMVIFPKSNGEYSILLLFFN